MMVDNYIVIERDLQQIADMLLLNATLTECPGLIHGKMGIAIFFFHYAQYTGNMLFADYAVDLIGEVQNQIHINSSADYEKGIAGIGIGIDYLIRNKYLVVEDDICKDFDQRMVRAVMHDPWYDFSLYDGLVGYGRYWISRLHYQEPSIQAWECLWHIIEIIEKKLPDISLEEQNDVYCFLLDWQKISDDEGCNRLLLQCQKRDVGTVFHRLANSTIGNITCKVQNGQYFNNAGQNKIDVTLKQIPDLDMERPPVNMGLLTGYAGEGMLRLTALELTDYSWTSLL